MLFDESNDVKITPPEMIDDGILLTYDPETYDRDNILIWTLSITNQCDVDKVKEKFDQFLKDCDSLPKDLVDTTRKQLAKKLRMVSDTITSKSLTNAFVDTVEKVNNAYDTIAQNQIDSTANNGWNIDDIEHQAVVDTDHGEIDHNEPIELE